MGQSGGVLIIKTDDQHCMGVENLLESVAYHIVDRLDLQLGRQPFLYTVNNR